MGVINSLDYHDFVFKDGKLIGEFEQMYQKASQIPWFQNEQQDWLDVRLSIELLKEFSPFDTIIDYGCGLGFYLNVLGKRLGTNLTDLRGFDISQTCCEKAKLLFPEIDFRFFDLMSDFYKTDPTISSTMRGNTLITIRATLWYLFPKIDNAVSNIANNSNKSDLLLISQNFPPLDSEFVGKEVIPKPESIVEIFDRYFEVIATILHQNRQSRGNDNWFIALFRRK